MMTKKTRVTAKEIYELLLNDFKIKEQIGTVEIILGGISAKYNGKDAIGDLLQEWLGEWLRQNNFYFRQPSNSQEFPDFLLSESANSDFLELKTFNADASPAFDIANFDSYCTSLLKIPERIEADYLILSYKMIHGQLSIDNIWLKKVWELTSSSGQDPIKLQVKRGQIYNLRPCTWYSKRLQYQPFDSKMDFLKAIAETHDLYPQCNQYKTDWLKIVGTKYLENTGVKL
jgi:NgoBV restriction endonuclease